MPVPSYPFGMAAGPFSGVAPTSVGLGKALPIGRDLELDPLTGDLKLTAGDLSLVADVPAIRQEADIRMKFFLGEWFLDINEGIPYFQSILVKAPNLNVIKGLFTTQVLATVGVSSLTSMVLDYDRAARTLSVDWSAVSDVGELIAGTLELEQ